MWTSVHEGSTPSSGTLSLTAPKQQMDNAQLIDKIVAQTRDKLKEEEKRLEEIQLAINNAPDYRQTWSDTTRFQLRQLKNNLEATHSKTKKALRAFVEFDATRNKKVAIGSLVRIGQELYLVTPPGSFRGELEIENHKITVLSPLSPFGKKMMGKKEGQSFSWQDQKLVINSVS